MRRLNARARVHSKRKADIVMDPIKLQIRPGARSNLFSRNSSSKHRKSSLFIFALISISFALLLCYLLVFGRSSRNSVKRKYGIVIDGGSTGTRIHVIEYRVENGNTIYDFGKDGLASMRVNPGLSAFAEDSHGAGGSLNELLEFGKGRVPKELWGQTEIRLMATAGLRLLESDLRDRIMESCRRVLRSSVFKFRDEWASIITGVPFFFFFFCLSPVLRHYLDFVLLVVLVFKKWRTVLNVVLSGADEGIYAWVVANYALGTLGGDPLQTTGIIELGGASAQV